MKIGDNPTILNSNSLLELESANKGFVFPRVSLTDVALPAPLAAGLLIGTVVYNINAAPTGGSGIGLYSWDGTKWIAVTPSSASAVNAWSLLGNAGTVPNTNFLGTTDAQDLVFRTNNTEKMRITSLGDLRIGGLTPSLPNTTLFTTRTVTATSGSNTAAEAKVIANPTASSSALCMGGYNRIDATNTSPITGAVYAARGDLSVTSASTAPVTTARGVLE